MKGGVYIYSNTHALPLINRFAYHNQIESLMSYVTGGIMSICRAKSYCIPRACIIFLYPLYDSEQNIQRMITEIMKVNARSALIKRLLKFNQSPYMPLGYWKRQLWIFKVILNARFFSASFFSQSHAIPSLHYLGCVHAYFAKASYQRFDSPIQNADSKRPSREYCSCFLREWRRFREHVVMRIVRGCCVVLKWTVKVCVCDVM